MELSKQVCTLEQAKRLVALGVYCPSVFVYFTTGVHSGIALGSMYIRHIWILTGNAYEDKDINITPAYTVAELGVMLPDYITIDDYRMHFRELKQEQNDQPALFTVTFGKSDDWEIPDFDSHIEAECRADLLIHLLENKLVTVEEINKRLQQ